MKKENELQYYLSVSPNKYGIYLFDTSNLTNLYKKEIILINDTNYQSHDELKKFLDDNIFKIEKLSGKFIENIFLILEDKRIFNVETGIKKKNYNTSLKKEYLQNLLVEAKDLFRENYPNQEIMHMIINKYFINDKSYSSYDENLNGGNFALQIQFKSISNSTIYDLNRILENYQIKIIKYIDGSYVKNYFGNEVELAEKAHRILNGYNENEVTFVPKNPKKLAFFEKFFQLFS